ncbi:MAG: YggS family pyridoxal phosphate-dependent enzyme [Candidatus Thermoplasmatota archaeon]|jgi:hypothetical protein|nr:YggS family pyridoxal phosphate-dependent enzyme [Candidatus Thermoplasmatota archaeon]MDP7266420.1 YggS family pyridoxal phosphate-dependent enzyme [Candidatus Thermoplasmatota archaeon]
MAQYDNLKTSLDTVRAKIARHCEISGRPSSSVCLIAVTKTHPHEVISLLSQLGVGDVGESYVDEFKVKFPCFPAGDVRWHFIGHLYRKHTPKVVGKAELIHSVDSLRLARKIDFTAGQLGVIQKILLQVNTSGEGTKQGFTPDSLKGTEFLKEFSLFENVEIKGLMTMAAFTLDEAIVRQSFRLLRETRDKLTEMTTWKLSELSMGMTNDYGIAIEEGATMVRIGTGLLGHRNVKPKS